MKRSCSDFTNTNEYVNKQFNYAKISPKYVYHILKWYKNLLDQYNTI
jgi:hypothetical protein